MKRNSRYLLLPVWVRVFSWVFLVLGLFALPLVVFSASGDIAAHFSLFGFEYEGSMRHLAPLAMAGCLIFLGYVAFALLWGKKNGRTVGLAAGYLGVALVLIATVVGFLNGRLILRLEL